MKHEINRPPVAVILAAGLGARLSPLTDDCATSLLSVGGSAILERMIRNCLSCGLSQFVLVLGHRADEIKQFVDKTFRGIRVTYVINERYRHTGTGYSLMLASKAIGTSEFIKFDAEVVFDVKILRQLVDDDRADVLCIDGNAALDDGDGKVVTDDQMKVLEVGKSVDPEHVSAKPIGIEKVSAKTGRLLFAELGDMMLSPARYKDDYDEAYALMVQKGTAFHVLDIIGSNWVVIDTAEDLTAATALFGTPITTVSRGQQRAMDEAAAKPVKA